ncbi:MAG: methyltransferase type 11 [Bacteroidetes bacterium]|jgi:hypothetical protein|nr:methyltransferase type 11 [Bacteroidota bacterium]
MSFQVPIVFIIYNRPEKTARVFHEIKKIKPTRLFVVADGPKNDTDKTLCDNAREVLNDINWETKLEVIQSENNMGNVSRTLSGLDLVFKKVDKAIILEDDCLPDLSFFTYCETLLHHYENDEQVMHISGFNILQEIHNTAESYFFSNFIVPPWGWATWKRAWKKHNPTMDSWQLHKKEIHPNISQEHFKIWTDTFEYLRIHKIGWDIPWNIDLWASKGVGIVPSRNLVQNIGFDDQATYTRIRSHFADIKAMEMQFPLSHPRTKKTLFDKEIEAMCVKLLKDISI